jgi:hypothetical protein
MTLVETRDCTGGQVAAEFANCRVVGQQFFVELAQVNEYADGTPCALGNRESLKEMALADRGVRVEPVDHQEPTPCPQMLTGELRQPHHVGGILLFKDRSDTINGHAFQLLAAGRDLYVGQSRG